jgi:DNA-binding NarL/FixJ family response regulator
LTTPRVAIVEDHLLLAEMLRAALEQSGIDATLVDLSEPDAVLHRLLVLRPTLVLLDLDLGAFGDSTRLIGPLCRSGIRVLVVTGTTDRLRIASALFAGAIGYQSKADGFDSLVDRALSALTADGALDPEHRAELLTELDDVYAERDKALAPFRRLTQRERETLALLAQGRSVAEIARSWVVSEATVRTHVRSLLCKLDVASQLGAVAAAARCGWFAVDALEFEPA